MIVLDSSAVLAFAHGGPGADAVVEALEQGAVVGAANWSEVSQKVMAGDREWPVVRAILDGFGLIVEPVTAEDAETAALAWRTNKGLSLGDRLCLALADRLGADALTADRAWGDEPPVRQIR